MTPASERLIEMIRASIVGDDQVLDGPYGPRRMTYGKVISNISFIKQTLNDQIRRLAQGDDRTEAKRK